MLSKLTGREYVTLLRHFLDFPQKLPQVWEFLEATTYVGVFGLVERP